MTVSSIDVFETTLHKANRWLKELMEELGWEDRHAAYLALRATLHALRDRLTVEEVAHLGAQLPMLIRGVYYEGWDPTGKPVPERRVEAFLLRIAQQFAQPVVHDAADQFFEFGRRDVREVHGVRIGRGVLNCKEGNGGRVAC